MLINKHKPSGLFITGTDTGVGKTFISALLCQLFKNEVPLKYFKPIQTGCDLDCDLDTVVRRAQLIEEQCIACAYSLKLPASPDRAAAAENIVIEERKILDIFNNNKHNFIIAEGAGGVEVPINDGYRMLDLMRDVQLPVVVVASTRLGTINHTLLTLKSLNAAGIEILGVVLSGVEDVGLINVLKREGVNVLAHVPLIPEAEPFERETFFGLETILTSLKERNTDRCGFSNWDNEHIWHPFTQHKVEKQFPIIRKGLGAYLYTDNGHRLLDATSSWWVNLHGHGHPEIVSAISQQAASLEHVLFAGYTHKPAIDLSQVLLSETQNVNKNLNRVFFSDNGSTAVEVALKMAYQYHALRGKKRERFLALNHSYHGDTVGAMSVSEPDGYHKYFLPLMIPVDHIQPDDFHQLEKSLSNMEQYAACIVEPLVQGASGMRMYSPEYLQQLQKYCHANGVLLIADEIFTGFCRTGTFFSSQQAQFSADLMCLSKGITGGYLPLSVTIATEDIYSTFLNDSKAEAFLHGHSYTANPIACAAAVKSYEILKRQTTQENILQITASTSECLSHFFGQHESIEAVRSWGTIGAMDLRDQGKDMSLQLNLKIAQECYERGVLLRPLGRTIYTVPPYCVSKNEIEYIYSTISDVLRDVL